MTLLEGVETFANVWKSLLDAPWVGAAGVAGGAFSLLAAPSGVSEGAVGPRSGAPNGPPYGPDHGREAGAGEPTARRRPGARDG